MSEAEIFSTMIWALLVLAVITFLVLMFITAPYGRHARGGWGRKSLPAPAGS